MRVKPAATARQLSRNRHELTSAHQLSNPKRQQQGGGECFLTLVSLAVGEAEAEGFRYLRVVTELLHATFFFFSTPFAVVVFSALPPFGKARRFQCGDTTNACTKVSTVARRCGCSALCCCLLPRPLGLSARCTGSPSVNSPTRRRGPPAEKHFARLMIMHD